MRKNGKYRFSLQFPAETEAQIKVGELLERIGNRKSTVIVEAVNDYIDTHPALLSDKGKITIRMESGYSRGQLEVLIRRILDERLADTRSTKDGCSASTNAEQLDDDITKMLDNLDFFQ